VYKIKILKNILPPSVKLEKIIRYKKKISYYKGKRRKNKKIFVKILVINMTERNSA
jgi:hypothetical protein